MTMNQQPVNILPHWADIGPQFVQHYYATFDAPGGKDQVVKLYHASAMVTFEGNQCQGHEKIMEAISKLSYQTIRRELTKVDCQPTLDGGILILVTGMLRTDDDPPVGFNQTFLVKAECSNFFIYHDIFRLSIHNTGTG